MKKTILIIILIYILTEMFGGTSFNWYSQSDSRWERTRLGYGGGSIGNSGCVLSCLSMLLNAEATNPRITPQNLNDWLKKNGGFAGNLMRWQVPGQIDGSGPGMELVSQHNKANDWKYLSDELDKGNKVIVKVSGRSSHWVLVVSKNGPFDKASSYIVNDPGMDRFEQRTLAFWGGFRAARSYSGNWLDEQAFSLESKINIEPVNTDEIFIYQLGKLPIPANVFVSLDNTLGVGITGYFLLGLFDMQGNLVRTVDYEYGSIGPKEKLDLIYEIADITPINEQGYDLRIIYSKYFSTIPSLFESIAVPSPGLSNNTTDTSAAN